MLHREWGVRTQGRDSGNGLDSAFVHGEGPHIWRRVSRLSAGQG